MQELLNNGTKIRHYLEIPNLIGKNVLNLYNYSIKNVSMGAIAVLVLLIIVLVIGVKPKNKRGAVNRANQSSANKPIFTHYETIDNKLN